MGDQPVEQVVRILPDRFGDDERGRWVDAGKDLHALLLGADEAMLAVGLVADGRARAVRRERRRQR